MNTKFKLLLLAIPLLLFSCSNDDSSSQQIQVNPGDIIVSAEGAFGSNNGSISLLSSDFETTTNFAYQQANNNTPLGGLVQSVAFGEEDIYVVLNDINTLVIADKNTLVRKDIITTGLQNPRYMAIVGNTGYITNWGDGSNTEDDYVAVLNLDTNSIDSMIPLANGVEQIVARDNKLYVSHKGAFSTNNIVSVIDLADNNSVTTITVNDNPDELLFLADGTLVVLSEGHTFFNADFTEVERETEGAISFINTITNTVERELTMAVGSTANSLALSEGVLYYASNEQVFALNANATALPTSGIQVGSVRAINVRDNELYKLDVNFSSQGTLSVFDLGTGEETFSTTVGLGASKIYFAN